MAWKTELKKELWKKYPNKKYCTREEINDIVNTLFPGAIVIARTDANEESVALYPDTEIIVARDGSNIKLKYKVLDPEFDPDHKRPKTLEGMEVEPTYDLKTHVQNLANKIIGLLNEFKDANQKKPILKYDENGKIIAIKTGDIIHTKK